MVTKSFLQINKNLMNFEFTVEPVLTDHLYEIQAVVPNEDGPNLATNGGLNKKI